MSKRSGNTHQAGFVLLIILTVLILLAATAVGVRLFVLDSGDGQTDGVVTTSQKTETEPPAPKYFTVNMQAGEENTGTLVLVNATHPYTFPEEEELVSLYEEGAGDYVKLSSSNIRLRREAMDALFALAKDFGAASGKHDLLVASGYRSYDEQVEIYSSRVDSKGIDYAKKYVAMPGCSEHHTGLCFDLSVYTDEGVAMHLDDSQEYSFVVEHCAEYGLIRRYDETKTALTGISGEDWHFRYVGAPHALYITQNGLCLEEYLELLAQHPESDPLILLTGDTRYTLYFVPVSPTGTTGIEVGEEYRDTYSISGTGCGGYAVALSEPYTPPGTTSPTASVSGGNASEAEEGSR